MGIMVSAFEITDPEVADGETIDIKVILSENNGVNPIVYYFKVPKKANFTLFDLMQHYFVIEHQNGYITSIQGKTVTSKTAWLYTINGEMAMVGAKDYKIKDGDVIHWDLRKW